MNTQSECILTTKNTPYSVQDINELTQRLQSVQTIVLSINSNVIFFAPGAFEHLISILQKNTLLKRFKLHFEEQELPEEEITALASMLQQPNCSIQSFTLDRFTLNNFQVLAPALAQNTSITHLELNAGGLSGSEQLTQSLALIAHTNCSIAHLSLKEDLIFRLEGTRPFSELPRILNPNITITQIDFLYAGKNSFQFDKTDSNAKIMQNFYSRGYRAPLDLLVLRNRKLAAVVAYSALSARQRQLIFEHGAILLTIMQDNGNKSNNLFFTVPIEVIVVIAAFAFHRASDDVQAAIRVLADRYQMIQRSQREKEKSANDTPIQRSLPVESQFSQALKKFGNLQLPKAFKTEILTPFKEFRKAYDDALQLPAITVVAQQDKEQRSNGAEIMSRFMQKQVKDTKDIVVCLEQKGRTPYVRSMMCWGTYFLLLAVIAVIGILLEKVSLPTNGWLKPAAVLALGSMLYTLSIRSPYKKAFPTEERLMRLSILQNSEHCLTPDRALYIQRLLTGLSDMEQAINQDQQMLDNVLQNSAPLPLMTTLRDTRMSSSSNSTAELAPTDNSNTAAKIKMA